MTQLVNSLARLATALILLVTTTTVPIRAADFGSVNILPSFPPQVPPLSQTGDAVRVIINETAKELVVKQKKCRELQEAKKELDKSNAYYTCGCVCMPFLLEDNSGSFILGDRGAAFQAETNKVKFQSGKILVVADAQSVEISTPCGDIQIPPGGSAILQVNPVAARILNLMGASINWSLKKEELADCLSINFNPGEELCAAHLDGEKSKEEDRVLFFSSYEDYGRTPIPMQPLTPGVLTAKYLCDRKQIAEKEVLFKCFFSNPTLSTILGPKIKKIRERLIAK